MENQNVSLTISKEIVTPIVNAKIQEAIILAMGGKDELIDKVVQNIFITKVNSSGNVSQYSSDNKFNWMEVVVTKQIEQAVKDAVAELLKTKQESIKKAIFKNLSSKQGIENFANALIDQTTKISDRYSSTISVVFQNK